MTCQLQVTGQQWGAASPIGFSGRCPARWVQAKVNVRVCGCKATLSFSCRLQLQLKAGLPAAAAFEARGAHWSAGHRLSPAAHVLPRLSYSCTPAHVPNVICHTLSGTFICQHSHKQVCCCCPTAGG